MSRHAERRAPILWLTIPILLTGYFTTNPAHGGPAMGIIAGLEIVFWGTLFRTRLASDAQALLMLNMMVAVHALFSLVYPYYPSPRATWLVGISALLTTVMATRLQLRWRAEDQEAAMPDHDAGSGVE